MNHCCLCNRHELEVPPHPSISGVPRLLTVPIKRQQQENFYAICRLCATEIPIAFAKETNKKPPKRPRRPSAA